MFLLYIWLIDWVDALHLSQQFSVMSECFPQLNQVQMY